MYGDFKMYGLKKQGLNLTVEQSYIRKYENNNNNNNNNNEMD